MTEPWLILKCECHEAVLELDETCWLQEDDTVLCSDGHADACREDYLGRTDRERGTQYKVRNLLGARLPRRHPARFLLIYGGIAAGTQTGRISCAKPVSRREAAKLIEDFDFESARARITTPNHERTTSCT